MDKKGGDKGCYGMNYIPSATQITGANRATDSYLGIKKNGTQGENNPTESSTKQMKLST